jgi:hypothetical protein
MAKLTQIHQYNIELTTEELVHLRDVLSAYQKAGGSSVSADTTANDILSLIDSFVPNNPRKTRTNNCYV